MIKKLIPLLFIFQNAYANETQSCNSNFGIALGQSNGVVAFSNCNENYQSSKKHFIEVAQSSKKIYTGLRWECVEYARRWLIVNRGITFPKIKSAYQLWNLKYFKYLGQKKQIPVEHYANKQSRNAPKVGDLIVYNKQLIPNGHVAIVVGVTNDAIMLAEQNYFNLLWEGLNYSRRLDLRRTNLGYVWIVDNYIEGWIHPNT